MHGTSGSAELSRALIRDRHGCDVWESELEEVAGKGWQQQWDHFLAAIRSGQCPNECEAAATSTMTAILGRLATYSGKVVKWNEALDSQVRLADTDRLRSLDDRPPVLPDSHGDYPVATPGGGSKSV